MILLAHLILLLPQLCASDLEFCTYEIYYASANVIPVDFSTNANSNLFLCRVINSTLIKRNGAKILIIIVWSDAGTDIWCNLSDYDLSWRKCNDWPLTSFAIAMLSFLLLSDEEDAIMYFFNNAVCDKRAEWVRLVSESKSELASLGHSNWYPSLITIVCSIPCHTNSYQIKQAIRECSVDDVAVDAQICAVWK